MEKEAEQQFGERNETQTVEKIDYIESTSCVENILIVAILIP